VRCPTPGLWGLTLDVVAPDKDAKSCMRSGETTRKRVLNYEQISAEPLPLWAVGFVMGSLSEINSAVVRFSKEEHNNVCYINHVVPRRLR
jgi:hypothetical protein